MVQAGTLANAVAVVAGVGFVLCRALAAIAPEFLLSVSQSWFHAVNVAPQASAGMSTGAFFLGLISVMAVAWAGTWAVAVLYIRWAK